MDPMLAGASWLDEELAGSTFADARLGQRLRRLLEQLGGAIGACLPLACQDWAATKAAYRFFDNDRVSEAEILAGHFAAIASRVAATEGPILILHDTTEFTDHRVRPEPVGGIGQYPCHSPSYDRRQLYTVCGLLCTRALASRRMGCRWVSPSCGKPGPLSARCTSSVYCRAHMVRAAQETSSVGIIWSS
jgi:Transposase DNA-binding